jgi:sarcosine oxidase subunit gamma
MAAWRRIGAWDGIARPGHVGISGAKGVVITPRHDLAAACLIGSERDADAIAGVFSQRFGIELPMTPKAASQGDLTLVWSGPSQWLALSRQSGLARRLADALRDRAAITDQSDARAMLVLEGAHMRDTLAKGCPIDLHPRSFCRGAAALTTIAGIGVQLWQTHDSDAFHIAVARSMAGSFWTWLTHSASEFGADVRAAD